MKRLGKVADFIDIVAKFVGAFLLFWGLLTFVPIVERTTKLVTGSLLGQTGSVYFEVDQNGNAWVNKGGVNKGRMVSSVVAINPDRRQFETLKWGDTLKVVTTGNFREAPKDEPKDIKTWTKQNRTLYKLRIGECLVFRNRYNHKPKNEETVLPSHGSFGYIKASTVACGMFN